MNKDKAYRELLAKAHESGMMALELKKPTPVVFYEAGLFTNKPNGESWHEPGGACGFAWIKIPNARQSFVCWLRKNDIGMKGYPGGGWHVSSYEFGDYLKVNNYHGQSIEKKEAYCEAVVKILNVAGLRCYSSSRLD